MSAAWIFHSAVGLLRSVYTVAWLWFLNCVREHGDTVLYNIPWSICLFSCWYLFRLLPFALLFCARHGCLCLLVQTGAVSPGSTPMTAFLGERLCRYSTLKDDGRLFLRVVYSSSCQHTRSETRGIGDTSVPSITPPKSPSGLHTAGVSARGQEKCPYEIRSVGESNCVASCPAPVLHTLHTCFFSLLLRLRATWH